MRLLLVEDDPSVREGLAELLADHGEVRAVGNLIEARQLMAEGPFDLIVTDLRLGGDRTAGQKMVTAARSSGVPVVIVSAASREEIDRALGDARPDAVLTKPFQLEDVDKLIVRFKHAAP